MFLNKHLAIASFSQSSQVKPLLPYSHKQFLSNKVANTSTLSKSTKSEFRNP